MNGVESRTVEFEHRDMHHDGGRDWLNQEGAARKAWDNRSYPFFGYAVHGGVGNVTIPHEQGQVAGGYREGYAGGGVH